MQNLRANTSELHYEILFDAIILRGLIESCKENKKDS